MGVILYEGMFVLDANKYAQDSRGLSGKIVETIEEAGGEVLVSRLWEERRLAYPIGGQRKGAYWLTYFKIDPQRLTDLNRQFHLNDRVLRFLFLKVDPRIGDALVEHALSGGQVQPAAAEAAPAEAESNGSESAPALATAGAPAESTAQGESTD